MKKCLTVLVIIFSSVIVFGQGRLGVKGGLNFTNVIPLSETLGSINGHMGLFYTIKKNDKWSLQPELLISQNSFYSDSFEEFDLTYLTIPVVFKYQATKSINLQMGAQYGALMEAIYTYGALNSTDMSAVIGIGYAVANTINLDFRAVPELTKLTYGNPFGQGGGLRKLNFQISLGFVIPREGDWSKKEQASD